MGTDFNDKRPLTGRDGSLGDHDSNPDPITGAPGSHPTGVGVGAASGAATGAALGALGGPIGAAIGIIAGGIVGGYVGKGVGEKIDPTEDVNYWREGYKSRPYFSKDLDYDRDLAPAYRYGSVAGLGVGDDYDRPVTTTAAGRTSRFEEYEDDFRAGWDKVKDKSSLTYDRARDAIRDAFDRRANKSDTSTLDR